MNMDLSRIFCEVKQMGDEKLKASSRLLCFCNFFGTARIPPGKISAFLLVSFFSFKPKEKGEQDNGNQVICRLRNTS